MSAMVSPELFMSVTSDISATNSNVHTSASNDDSSGDVVADFIPDDLKFMVKSYVDDVESFDNIGDLLRHVNNYSEDMLNAINGKNNSIVLFNVESRMKRYASEASSLIRRIKDHSLCKLLSDFDNAAFEAQRVLEQSKYVSDTEVTLDRDLIYIIAALDDCLKLIQLSVGCVDKAQDDTTLAGKLKILDGHVNGLSNCKRSAKSRQLKSISGLVAIESARSAIAGMQLTLDAVYVLIGVDKRDIDLKRLASVE